MKNRSREKVLMVGIGGSGMRGLALLLRADQYEVLGCDFNYEAIHESEDLEGMELTNESEAVSWVTNMDKIVYSDAVKGDHMIRREAKKLGVREMSYQEALGEYSQRRTTIAITGTHGKTSTTAMLASILIHAGLDPSVLVGAPLQIFGNRNARVGKSNLLIVEADEYREHFLELRPQHVIITTIDFDHPDYYQSLDHVKEAYVRFWSLLPDEGKIIVPKNVVEEYQDMLWPKQTIVVKTDESIELPIPGKHFKSNAGLALNLALELGVKHELAVEGLKMIGKIGRRWEKIGRFNDSDVISDYGHHPTEITATWKAANEEYTREKILAVVEIHTLERLEEYFEDYALSLSEMSQLVLTPVFLPRGREGDQKKAAMLLDELEKRLNDGGSIVYRLKNYNELKILLSEIDGMKLTLAFSAGVLDSHLRKLIASL